MNTRVLYGERQEQTAQHTPSYLDEASSARACEGFSHKVLNTRLREPACARAFRGAMSRNLRPRSPNSSLALLRPLTAFTTLLSLPHISRETKKRRHRSVRCGGALAGFGGGGAGVARRHDDGRFRAERQDG